MLAIPFITAMVFAMIFATFADWLILTQRLSVNHTRKLANHIGLIGTAVGYVSLCFVGCNYILAEVVIVLTVTVNSTIMSGYMVRALIIKFEGC